MQQFTINGQLVDIFKQDIYPVQITIGNGIILSINHFQQGNIELPFILPGFIDSHVHIESSMLIPSQFARLAVVHGTVATVSDPHEIANVCGIEGVEFMIRDGKTVPFKFNFGAPSCVPATIYETSGSSLDSAAVEQLLKKDEIKYLSEMMNFPGVLSGEEEVIKKIETAHRMGKPVDGHAPGLRGQLARQYIEAGISTDHECFTKEEALDKLGYGMKILIREGSAAKNFEALIDLLNDYPDNVMFCTDDKHPDSLVEGHINQLCARAVSKKIDLFKIVKAACLNPVLHYKLDVGLLRKGDPADFIVVKDLKQFQVLKTFINGVLVAENGESCIAPGLSGTRSTPINNFNCSKKSAIELEMPVVETNRSEVEGSTIQVIEALDGQLITNKLFTQPKIANGKMVTDLQNDILKIVIVNRYQDAPIAKAFIKNFGLKKGAIASSVAHDSHNIVAVGVEDESICKAINLIINENGGISCISDKAERVLALPVSGLMSAEDGYKVAEAYTAIDAMAKSLGSNLSAPFMTLSFMALLVIPHLKLSDKGLFDGDAFRLM